MTSPSEIRSHTHGHVRVKGPPWAINCSNHPHTAWSGLNVSRQQTAGGRRGQPDAELGECLGWDGRVAVQQSGADGPEELRGVVAGTAEL